MEADLENTPQFATADEAAQFWKDTALRFRQQFIDALQQKQEVEELTSINDELMKSLETQVNSLEEQNGAQEDRIQQLSRQLAVAKEEVQNLRELRREESTKLQSEVQELITKVKQLESKNESLQKEIVQLEQNYENESRLLRTNESRLQRAETERDDILERFAMLQTEYDELKESHQESMQRMKEELRDALEDAEVNRRVIEDTRKAVAATKTQVSIPSTPPRLALPTHNGGGGNGGSSPGVAVTPRTADAMTADPAFVKGLLSSVDNALYLFESLEEKLGLKDKNPRSPRPPLSD